MPLRLLRAFQRPTKAPASTDGRLIYAIGDVHGRLDLFAPLLDQIYRDAASSDDASVGKPVLVFLGDYVDRGAQSRGVLDGVIALDSGGMFEVRALKGNHEEALLAFLSDPDFGPAWCGQGGAETLQSYGVAAPTRRSDAEDWRRASEAFEQALPDDHLRLLARLELTAVYGDYLFVHAGVRPGVPLQRQVEADLLWIRQPFLGSDRPCEKIVVHGHTPAEQAYLGPHRIGVDTGAYATGLLTAVRLFGADRRLLQARAA